MAKYFYSFLRSKKAILVGLGFFLSAGCQSGNEASSSAEGNYLSSQFSFPSEGVAEATIEIGGISGRGPLNSTGANDPSSIAAIHFEAAAPLSLQTCFDPKRGVQPCSAASGRSNQTSGLFSATNGSVAKLEGKPSITILPNNEQQRLYARSQSTGGGPGGCQQESVHLSGNADSGVTSQTDDDVTNHPEDPCSTMHTGGGGGGPTPPSQGVPVHDNVYGQCPGTRVYCIGCDDCVNHGHHCTGWYCDVCPDGTTLRG